ncbi:hypothetical protein Cfor_02893 [Coptotermes formosanus]|uniref:C2H2-type domain-containing protein n=1 Tax=Coptotermes formosanus TaxID=36987 RepID=A0A6L2Q462_COPFO|nr:hypothetical protein Cfor_02893 [Coptotermes formosanus]
MDRIKVEPNLEAVATPLFSPGEEKCIDIKEEECHSGPQICLIKEEEELGDHTKVKKELKQEKTISGDCVEEMMSHEDSNNCDIGKKLCLVAPAEETSSGIGKINQIKITDIFPGRQHSVDNNHIVSGILIYRCGFCNRVFSLMRDLEVHILTHVQSKPYTCEICKRNFTQSTSLTIHMRRHTGQKPFKCEVCNRCFTRKDNLSAHKLLHFGEKRYICEVCEKPFLRMQHLNGHMRMHTRRRKCHRCDVCSSEFPRLLDLLNHMCRHLKEVK